jgi:hypothetical protein
MSQILDSTPELLFSMHKDTYETHKNKGKAHPFIWAVLAPPASYKTKKNRLQMQT